MNDTDLTKHRCHICHRGYQRVEHLKRHVATHAPVKRKFDCVSCDRSFSRSDALKRHSRTCTVLVEDRFKCTKRRACDRCVQAKKACNLGQPCSTCLGKNATCRYSVAEKDSVAALLAKYDNSNDPSESTSQQLYNRDGCDSSFWTMVNFDLFDLATVTWNDYLDLLPAEDPQKDQSNRPDLDFLDNFTKRTGLVDSFDCASLELRLACLEVAKKLAHSPAKLDFSDSMEERFDNYLAKICLEIGALVKEVATIKPRNSAVEFVWSDSMHQSCQSFFSPANVRKYLELYWSIWHPNVNIVHRPTFHLAPAKTVLVAAMATIGAAVSPAASDVDSARVWFNAVEEIVFLDSDLCNTEVSSGQFPSPATVQALQAGYIVCLYQNWEGTDAAKRRIRRHRSNTLVSAIRDIGIHNVKHSWFDAHTGFDWLAFAVREQLIRTVLWIFLLDTAFVIFNNLPPRMVIKEMSVDAASSEDIFQAQSSLECLTLLREKQSRGVLLTRAHYSTLYHASQALCMENLDARRVSTLANLGPLNLFVITSSLHSMLFQYQNGFNARSQLIPLRNALENWKNVWSRYIADGSTTAVHNPLAATPMTAENMWRRVGFVRYASEYWLLASLLLDRICVAESQSEGLDQSTVESTELSNEEPTHAILQRYDETSMQQVNDLIADFQRANISTN